MSVRPTEAEAHLWALVVWFGQRYENPYVDRDVVAAAHYVNEHLGDMDMSACHRAVLGRGDDEP